MRYLLLLLVLTSCSHFAGTNVSVWSDNLWLILALPTVIGLICAYKAVKGRNSGTIYQDQTTGKDIYDSGKLPWLKIGWTWGFLICVAAVVVMIIVVNGER